MNYSQLRNVSTEETNRSSDGEICRQTDRQTDRQTQCQPIVKKMRSCGALAFKVYFVSTDLNIQEQDNDVAIKTMMSPSRQ